MVKESVVQKMSAQQYEKNADKIMEAIRSGKFVYDISGFDYNFTNCNLNKSIYFQQPWSFTPNSMLLFE